MIAAIVLAAGTSSRLGRPKQLLLLGGTPVLTRVAEAALAAPVGEVVVVVGHRAEEVSAVLPPDARVRPALNPDFSRGQAGSLRTGLDAVSEDAEAVVVLLADQPGIRPDAIEAVVAAFHRGSGPVVQASYGGRPAHPTLLARPIWAEVAKDAAGDAGARGVLAHHPEWRSLVEVGGDPPADIDTEDDYRKLKAAFGELHN